MIAIPRVILSLLAFLLASCASQPPLSSLPPAPPIVRFEAILEPGCLLPPPDILRRATVQSATVIVLISETGSATTASLKGNTGSVELDNELVASMLRCNFSPAYDAGGMPYVKKEVAITQEVAVVWPSDAKLIGPSHCIQPAYPHAARRSEESGRVRVAFQKRSSDGQIEAQIREGSAKLRVLRPLSIRAVTQCLQHDSVQSELDFDKWYLIDYVWRLY